VSARGKARKRALDVLFEAEQRDRDVLQTLAEHRTRIDDLLATYAIGWTLDRMPAVDRNVLRLGVYELLWADDVPDAVVIDEAVELAKALSTDESPAYVNGVLGAILAAEVPTGS
jgi:transcription antitermination protein NusB